MIPFHYPPMVGSSGVQRSLHFSVGLQNHGWEAIVLTAHERVHSMKSDEALNQVKDKVQVKRSFAIDVAQHLPFGGRYPRFMALPDRWSTWVISSVLKGWWLAKRQRPDVIWTTYPIASSHLIGYFLSKITGLPWVADFRDPMTEEDYPYDPTLFKLYRWIEKKVMMNAKLVVVTTPGVKRVYGERYGEACKDKIKIVQNGFDESKFSFLGQKKTAAVSAKRPLRVVHSGVIYSEERNPEPLFAALSELKSEGIITADVLSVELRSAGSDDLYNSLLKQYTIQDIVKLLPSISHKENIEDMCSADILLLLQGSTCNEQIPAKAYEYIRSGNPIIALTDKKGDTGQLLTQLGIGIIAPLEEKEEIKKVFAQVEMIKNQFCPLEAENIQKFSRQKQTEELAELLNTLA